VSSAALAEDPALARQRVVVEVVADPADIVLASGWLRHGDTPQEVLVRVLTLAGVPGDRAQTLVADLTLAEVTSDVVTVPTGTRPVGPHATSPRMVRVHRIGLRFALPAAPLAVLHRAGQGAPQADPVELLAHGAGDARLDGMHAGHDPTPAQDDAIRIQRVGCYALVREAGRVLLTRLRRTGLWALPGGGVDHGEHPDATLRREVFEESGFELTDVRLAGVGTARWTGHAPSGQLEDFHAVHVLYTGRAPAGMSPQVVEVDGSTDRVSWVEEAHVAGLRLTPSALRGLGLMGIRSG
jgi:8-oxo-dGTP pyrophosphatase MutT (NUDIX family)